MKILSAAADGRPHLHEARHDVNGNGEDNCAIVLGRASIQGLEIPQLQKKGL